MLNLRKLYQFHDSKPESEKNEKEEDMFPDKPDIRLACQSKIKEGTIKINTSY